MLTHLYLVFLGRAARQKGTHWQQASLAGAAFDVRRRGDGVGYARLERTPTCTPLTRWPH